MNLPKKSIFCAAILVIVSLSSCVSSGPDAFMAKNLTPQEKSRILYEKGLALYEEKLLGKNDLAAIPEVRSYFEAAVLADPMNLKAQEYLSRTDAFKATRFNAYMKSANRLKEKKKRTDSENYELVLATRKAEELDSGNSELQKLKSDTADVRKQVIQKRVAGLDALEKKLKASKAQAEVAKLLPQTAKLIGEIQLVDPENKDAAGAKKSMDEVVYGLVRKDLDAAKAALGAGKYAAAETSLLRAEKTLRGVTRERNAELVELKYQVYFKWAQEFYGKKEYISADNRVNVALGASNTPEARDLKLRISKAVAAKTAAAKGGAAAKGQGKKTVPAVPSRDYDAEIDGILESIDATIARDDLKGAADMIEFNSEMMKEQANKDKLSAKRGAVQERVKALYAESVAAYNEEDYETARDGFLAVLRVSPGYEQAQAYLDKANNKIRALEGN